MGTREVNQDVTGTPTSRKKLIASMDNKTLLYLNDTGLLAAYLKGDCSEELFAYVSKTAQGVLTTRGDLLFRGAVVPTRLAKGTLGQLLAQGANDPQWSDAVLVRGGILTRDNLGVVELSVGAADEVLTSDGTDAAWATPGGGGLTSYDPPQIVDSAASAPDPSFVSVSDSGTKSNDSNVLNVPFPASAKVGDLLILVIFCTSTSILTVLTPSKVGSGEWTEGLNENTSSRPKLQSFYKRVTPTDVDRDDITVMLAVSNTIDAGAICGCFRDASGPKNFDVEAKEQDGFVLVGSHVSETTTVDNAMIVWFAVGSASLTFSFQEIGGNAMTERVDGVQGGMMATYVQPTAGATGTWDALHSANSYMGSIKLVLLPREAHVVPAMDKWDYDRTQTDTDDLALVALESETGLLRTVTLKELAMERGGDDVMRWTGLPFSEGMGSSPNKAVIRQFLDRIPSVVLEKWHVMHFTHPDELSLLLTTYGTTHSWEVLPYGNGFLSLADSTGVTEVFYGKGLGANIAQDFTVAARVNFWCSDESVQMSGGIFVEQSGGAQTRFVLDFSGATLAQLRGERWSNDTTRTSTNAFSRASNTGMTGYIYLALRVDYGTNVSAYYSMDGNTWIQYGASSFTAGYIIPNIGGVFVRESDVASFSMGVDWLAFNNTQAI